MLSLLAVGYLTQAYSSALLQTPRTAVAIIGSGATKYRGKKEKSRGHICRLLTMSSLQCNQLTTPTPMLILPSKLVIISSSFHVERVRKSQGLDYRLYLTVSTAVQPE